MDVGNITVGITFVVGIVVYITWLLKKSNRDIKEWGYQSPSQLLLLAPKPQIVIQKPEPVIVLPKREEEETGVTLSEAKSLPPDAVSSKESKPVPAQDSMNITAPLAGDSTPLDQLESRDKKAYCAAICDMVDIAEVCMKEHGKITKDGMVPKFMNRRTWDHTCRYEDGILWKALILEKDDDGNTVLSRECNGWLDIWMKDRGFKLKEFEEGEVPIE